MKNKIVNEIEKFFTSQYINQNAFFVSGKRGTERTTVITQLSEKMSKKEKWIVMQLKANSEDIFIDIIQNLYSRYQDVIDRKGPVYMFDTVTTASHIIELLSKEGYKFLFLFDNLACNKGMYIFAGAFQMWIGHGITACFVIAGTQKNIDKYKNHKTITFLWRATTLYLQPRESSVDYKSLEEL